MKEAQRGRRKSKLTYCFYSSSLSLTIGTLRRSQFVALTKSGNEISLPPPYFHSLNCYPTSQTDLPQRRVLLFSAERIPTEILFD